MNIWGYEIQKQPFQSVLKKWSVIIVTRSGKIVWKHGPSYWNLYIMLKFTERSKTPAITLRKTWLSLKGIRYLQVIFVLIWIKQTLIWLNLQRDGTETGLPNIKGNFAENLQQQMSVLHQLMCIFKAGLPSLSDGCTKYKEKVPDVGG